jgi:hypothetical protein
MKFKYFTNASEGFEGSSIAINPSFIVSVLEKKITVAANDGNKEDTQTILFGGANGTWIVTEDMLTVVARLNERD